ncbi:hypothetical protein CVT24_012561 [Panaeolus cyanescens]|uniref:WW domain-containing protein n=1 Tax=Panaeolus cyanescens TaxID=181874 RepID=A0A409W2J6_9AGAR|nr:hypothetical protein CVT24_012561 [Panaeolus cyanescens]
MTTARPRLRVRAFITMLYRLLARILKPQLIERALEAILKRLAFIWIYLRKKLSVRPKTGSDETTKPKLTDPSQKTSNTTSIPPETPLAVAKDETRISLEGVDCSSLPYIPRLQKESTRSLQNLERSREQHSLKVISSRNNSHATEIHDIGEPETFDANVGGGYTIDIESPTRSPTAVVGTTSGPPPPEAHDAHSIRKRSPSPAQSISDLQAHLTHLQRGTPSIHTINTQRETGFLQPTIWPMAPEKHKRYFNRHPIQHTNTKFTVPPLTVSFASELPGGWTMDIHTEGARYFFHPDKKMYTDANLFDGPTMDYVEETYAQIYDYIKHRKMPHRYNIVLDVTYYEDLKCFVSDYYFVDHTSRTVFWIDEFHADTLDTWGSVSGRELGAQYWHHCQLYPTSFDLTKDVVKELRDIILHNIGDCTTSPYSTSPYTLDELYRMLSLMRDMQENTGNDPLNIGTRNLVARIFWVFARERFIHFYGERCARLDRTRTIYDGPPRLGQRTWLIRSVSPFLFTAPEVNLVALQKMFVDDLINLPVFERTMKRLSDEWQEMILFATVLLNANVAFLAIQSVDIESPSRTPIQISCYLSIISSVGCIIIALLLMRQTRNKRRESADEAQQFLTRRSSMTFGLESLAIMYSLPYAFLMWAMVSFLLAFCFLCYLETSIVTRVVVAPPGLALIIVIVWCVWIYWEQIVKETPPEAAPDEADTTSVIAQSPENMSLKSEKSQKGPPRSQWMNTLPRFVKSFPWSLRKNSDETVGGNNQSHV